MTRNMTCIVCPMGCSITVETEDGIIQNISGNSCPRGAQYAKSECTNPTRTVTTTAMGSDGYPIPVKTDRPIPKDKIRECMDIINRIVVDVPVKIGDVAAKDVFGSNIVVTANHGGKVW